MAKIDVKWLPKEGGLSEIYQTTQMQFAFLSSPEDGNKQCHKFVLCRDFLHDAVRWYLLKMKDSIYGFAYSGTSNPPIDMEMMRMMATKKGLTPKDAAVFAKKMRLAKKMVNFYEKMAGWKLSTLSKIDSKDKNRIVWLFKGPKEWLMSPFLVSMYTFIIRLGDKTEHLKFKSEKDLAKAFKAVSDDPSKFNVGGHSDNDATYLRTCYDKLSLVIKNHKELFFEEGEEDPIYRDKNVGKQSFHDRGGIVTLCRFNTPHQKLNDKFKALYEENKNTKT
jgi:hypothetical protein